MKRVSAILLVFLSCAFSFAQDKNESNSDLSSILKNGVISDDGCGDQAYESQLYDNREGKITKILSANQVVFEQAIEEGDEENRKFTVELVGINPATNRKKVLQFLEKYVLNRDVEVTGNLRKESDKKFKGLLFVANDDDDVNWVNENLLEKGIAKYKSFESANLVSMIMPCRLQKAEERAKEAKLGIWVK